jgi:hypothetical protein
MAPLRPLVHGTGRPGVFCAVVPVRIFPDLDLLPPGDRPVEQMVEPVSETLTDSAEVLTLFFGEALLPSIPGLLGVVRIEFVLYLQTRFSYPFPEFRVLVDEDRLSFPSHYSFPAHFLVSGHSISRRSSTQPGIRNPSQLHWQYE